MATAGDGGVERSGGDKVGEAKSDPGELLFGVGCHQHIDYPVCTAWNGVFRSDHVILPICAASRTSSLMLCVDSPNAIVQRRATFSGHQSQRRSRARVGGGTEAV